MLEVVGNLWDFYDLGEYVCITTNGVVRSDGACVMGRGTANQATKKIPGIQFEIGNLIKLHGNVPHYIPKKRIITFPVKHHWADEADLELIKQSAETIQIGTYMALLQHVYLPRPGCGNGRLNWATVKPMIASILDDRFTVVEWNS